MADQKHVKRLLKSVEAWNTWRERYPTIKPDLSKAIFINADLSGAILFDANFTDADLRSADLSGASLNETDLRGADLRGANLNDAILRNTIFSSVDLSNATFIDANLSGAILSGANLSNADFSRAILDYAILSGADLRGADLRGADLDNADLRNADLRNANLTNASLNDTILSGANLSGADFSGARIGWISFGDRDFREIKGLETVEHYGPSPVSINSLSLSDGAIPEQFLRGTGAQDTFVDYVKSLTTKPIEYYTCFISYSSKDQNFVERLYADLQNNGVRCWYASEDLKIGEKFRQRIDESIKLHDKLLLVLSEHSVQSPWVEKEVETAMEKEHKQKKLVLFPVKLDKTVMETDQAWAADIRRMYHIGDFFHWDTDYTVYQKGLSYLLRDLKAESTH